jgi:diguanylate cyclase (GGDEF)-like protein/PAS domain S-box-containing protein
MEHNYRIVIFTPHLDGDYFGKILNTINRAAQAYNWRLTIIQTQSNHPYGPMADDPLLLDTMDACILLLDAVGERTKKLLAECGKPIISIGYLQEDLPCHSVLIDNRFGASQAVNHLADHGHTAIAFIGTHFHYDQAERLVAYKDTLEARAIPYNPELVVKVKNNLMSGGIEGIDILLERGVHFTAVVASTDKNAFGAISRLRDRGLDVPGNIVVTGFDDIEQSADAGYSLTTVRQSYTDLAYAAVNLLHDALLGRSPAQTLTTMPVSLVVRRSCGCMSAASGSVEDVQRYSDTIAELRHSLREIEISNSDWIQTMIEATSMEHFEMKSLFRHTADWGYLALWDDPSERQRLVIERSFSRSGHPAPLHGQAYPVRRFPPVEALPHSAQSCGTDCVVLHPVKSSNRDWGYMVLAGPLDRLSTVFSSNLAHQSYNLLAAVLERESLFGKLRTVAEQLEIVSNSTNDGIWDWNIRTNKVEWNNRFLNLTHPIRSSISEDPQQFFTFIHPDDRERMTALIEAHLKERKPYQAEFRMLPAAAEAPPVWLYVAGEAMFDDAGNPVRMIGSVTDITTKKMDEERIRHLAYHDPLTGMPNRAYFFEHALPMMEQKWQQGKQSAILLMDLDSFKLTNDTLGHLAGDKLLQHVSGKLRESVRPGDVVARLGGDEFIILLSAVSGVDEIVQIVTALIDSLAAPLVIMGREVFTTASIGACLYPDHGDSIETLIKHADMSMYKAKENGRDQMVLYTPDLSSKFEKRFLLGNNLRRAVEKDEFVLHYQPQIDLSTGRILGAEALLRWHSAEHGIVQPNDFIPLAEETGWIVPISVWVVREACHQIIEWQRMGMPQLIVSVNVSAQHFRQQHFSSWVRTVLEETGVDAHLLCLEITETTAIHNMEHSAQMLQELADIGIRIAIDDFGTGHSSLMLLRRLPIHTVKIDKSFVRHMTEDSDDAAIVKAVIAMSHSLGLFTIAEGVEGQDQVQQLRHLGCDHIQGYYIGKPMPADQFEQFMASQQRQPHRFIR